jgi:hypothetical protein
MLRPGILILLAIVATKLPAATPATGAAPIASPDPQFVVGDVLAHDDFTAGLALWQAELEKGGEVTAQNGQLEINVPGGCTLWLKAPLAGPVLIAYEATVIGAGGPNDRVSDLNCFWMARDARSRADIFATARSGKFSDYDRLECYYVGLGGNSNTTTRFRRYIGQAGNRPLLPEHDLSAKEFLLTPNAAQTIQLIAADSTIEYFRNGRRLFRYEDSQPYTSGWFAFRTVKNHLTVKNFRVYRLIRADHPPTTVNPPPH